MFNFVKDMIANKQSDFSIEERNLLLISFKKAVQVDRDAIKLVRDVSANEKFASFVQVLTEFKKRLHRNIVDRCDEICQVCHEDCLELAENSESKVFFYKLIGDYNRYASESYDTDTGF